MYGAKAAGPERLDEATTAHRRRLARLAPPFLRVDVLRCFVVACAAGRDEADRFFMAVCHRGRPHGLHYQL